MCIWRYVSAGIVLLLTVLCSVAALADTESNTALAKQAVVFIRHRDCFGNFSSGTGFFVSSNGYIITCAHVVSPVSVAKKKKPTTSDAIWVRTASGSVLNATRVYSDSKMDVALLAVSGTSHPCLALGSTPMQGAEVLVLGYPLGQYLGKEMTVTRGIVSALRQNGSVFQLDAATNPGCSGGPILNKDGYVVGIAWAKLPQFEGLNFAISVSALPSVDDMIARSPLLIDWLFNSITQGDLTNISKILDFKPSLLNARNREGTTALIKATDANQLEVAEYLIAQGADVNAKEYGDKYGWTALETAAFKGGRSRIAEMLIDNGADMGTQGDFAPIHSAAANGDLELLRVLSTKGANLAVKDIIGDTALHNAAGCNQLGAAQFLIESGLQVNARNEENETPLHEAARVGCTEVAKLLIDNGAEVNAKDKNGVTPLHRASECNQVKMIRLLLSAGAQLNVRTSGNALFYMPKKHKSKTNTEMDIDDQIREILAQGRGIHAGVTPLTVAELCKSSQAAAVLRKAGGRK